MCLNYNSEPNVIVDLRSELPPIRDQGPRPLCLVFATSDLNSHANSLVKLLSVEFLAHHAYIAAGHTDYLLGLPVYAVTESLKTQGQPPEYMLPYKLGALKPEVPQAIYPESFSSKSAENKPSLADITNLLDTRTPVVVCFSLPSLFFNPRYPHIIDDGADHKGVHAVIVIGYGKYPDGEICILIRNSWGVAWGNNGYAWITSAFLKNRTLSSLRLTL